MTPSRQEIASWFEYSDEGEEAIRTELDDAEIVYACYETGNYEGEWDVIYVKGGQWFRVSGSHCSCNGPEWRTPQPTTREQALKDYAHEYGNAPQARDAIAAFGDAKR